MNNRDPALLFDGDKSMRSIGPTPVNKTPATRFPNAAAADTKSISTDGRTKCRRGPRDSSISEGPNIMW